MDNRDCVKGCIEHTLHHSMDCHMTGVCAGVLTFHRGIASDSSFKSEMQFCIVIASRDSKDIQCTKDEKSFHSSVEYH